MMPADTAGHAKQNRDDPAQRLPRMLSNAWLSAVTASKLYCQPCHLPRLCYAKLIRNAASNVTGQCHLPRRSLASLLSGVVGVARSKEMCVVPRSTFFFLTIMSCKVMAMWLICLHYGYDLPIFRMLFLSHVVLQL